MAFYRPATAARQAELQPSASALLFIDVQIYNCSKAGTIYQSLNEQEQQASGPLDGGVGAGSGNWESGGHRASHPNHLSVEPRRAPLFSESGRVLAAVGAAAACMPVSVASLTALGIDIPSAAGLLLHDGCQLVSTAREPECCLL